MLEASRSRSSSGSLSAHLSRIGLCIGLLIAGCSSQPPLGAWQGPSRAAASENKEWAYGDEKGAILESAHYRIYTTIKDEEVLALLPQVMEGALTMYAQVAEGVVQSERPLECFVFRWRSEWDSYTMRFAGNDADVYRQIRSGGYTIGDRYVAYYIGRLPTFSVAAHEGWHQFAGRHFKGRLPPFFEEGLACMFETIDWKNDLPRFNLSVNAPRAQTLRKTIESNNLLSLGAICQMHAGDIVGEADGKIDAFYAQSWAFARFLWEGDNGKWRPAMQKWLAETANGTVKDPTGCHKRAFAPWNRRAVRPMIEHYLGADIDTLDKAYQAYIRKIAYEELPAHWRS